MRPVIVGLSLIFLLLALPSDLRNIYLGLADPGPDADWRLSLGLSLKTLMTLGAILGLAWDKTLGYCFLLGASLQISLIRVGEFQAVDFREYPAQLVLPALDLVFRALCFGFLLTRWRRLVGEGVSA